MAEPFRTHTHTKFTTHIHVVNIVFIISCQFYWAFGRDKLTGKHCINVLQSCFCFFVYFIDGCILMNIYKFYYIHIFITAINGAPKSQKLMTLSIHFHRRVHKFINSVELDIQLISWDEIFRNIKIEQFHVENISQTMSIPLPIRIHLGLSLSFIYWFASTHRFNKIHERNISSPYFISQFGNLQTLNLLWRREPAAEQEFSRFFFSFENWSSMIDFINYFYHFGQKQTESNASWHNKVEKLLFRVNELFCSRIENWETFSENRLRRYSCELRPFSLDLDYPEIRNFSFCP